MIGEISLKVSSVSNGCDFVRPYSEYNNKVSTDLSMFCEDETTFHICGDNDWAYLALDILRPIFKEAEDIINKIDTAKRNGFRPQVILLGKNEQRIMDIYYGVIYPNKKHLCDNIVNVPVARSKKVSELNFVGIVKEEDCELPF